MSFGYLVQGYKTILFPKDECGNKSGREGKLPKASQQMMPLATWAPVAAQGCVWLLKEGGQSQATTSMY